MEIRETDSILLVQITLNSQFSTPHSPPGGGKNFTPKYLHNCLIPFTFDRNQTYGTLKTTDRLPLKERLRAELPAARSHVVCNPKTSWPSYPESVYCAVAKGKQGEARCFSSFKIPPSDLLVFATSFLNTNNTKPAPISLHGGVRR